MAWGVDQVDQEIISVRLLGNVLDVFLVGKMGVQRDGGGLDRDTSILLILTSIGETSLAGFRGRDDTSPLNQRVGKSGLSMVD